MRRCTRIGVIGALALAAGTVAAGPAEFSSVFTWRPAGLEGGMSGIELDAAGQGFVIVADRGQVITGRFVRDGGRISGTAGVIVQPILNGRGRPVRRFAIDAEGVALVPGGFAVSFEAIHRVEFFATPVSPATDLGAAPAFSDLQNNSGLEALAALPDGTLLAIPERSGALDRPFPVYRGRDGRWDVGYRLARRGDYLPVGADIGPDGQLYLLERDFVWYRGFRNRLRRFDLGKGVLEGETLLETAFGQHDNLEGIAVWAEDDGTIVLTMISDDNGSILQTSEVVEYRISPGD